MADYDLRLGPLRFVAPSGPISLSLGDALEAIGGLVLRGERRARALKLPIIVRGADTAADPKAEGYRIRREVVELLENARATGAGLFLSFGPDPELDAWIRVGGGDLEENELGVTFGEWELELTDAYLAGRPSTHRPARRLELGDRRTGQVARDTRARLYSSDHAAVPLPTLPLVIPGDAELLRLTRGRTPTTADGPTRSGRRLFRRLSGVAGDTASYRPSAAVAAAGGHPYADLGAPGSVRVWDVGASTVDVNAQASTSGWTAAGDADPTLYGWRRVYGPSRTLADRPLAIDNGLCRVIFLGLSSSQGVAVESFEVGANTAPGQYRREARIAAASSTAVEVNVVELTTERAVVEFRYQNGRLLRVILQRGWYGPRVEAYNDDAGTARLEICPVLGAPVITQPAAPNAHVDLLDVALVNGIRNPHLGTNLTDWLEVGGALTSFLRVADGGALPRGFAAERIGQPSAGGEASILVGTSAGGTAVAATEEVLARIAARLITADAGVTVRPFVRWYTAGGAFNGDTFGATTDASSLTAKFLTMRATAPAGSAFATVGAQWQGLDVGQVRTLRAWAALTIRNPPPTDPGYFDGATPGAALGNPFTQWTGAADASQSQLVERIRWVKGTDADARTTFLAGNGQYLNGAGVSYSRTGVVVAQLHVPGTTETVAEIASVAIVDARSIQALVRR